MGGCVPRSVGVGGWQLLRSDGHLGWTAGAVCFFSGPRPRASARPGGCPSLELLCPFLPCPVSSAFPFSFSRSLPLSLVSVLTFLFSRAPSLGLFLCFCLSPGSLSGLLSVSEPSPLASRCALLLALLWGARETGRLGGLGRCGAWVAGELTRPPGGRQAARRVGGGIRPPNLSHVLFLEKQEEGGIGRDATRCRDSTRAGSSLGLGPGRAGVGGQHSGWGSPGWERRGGLSAGVWAGIHFSLWCPWFGLSLTDVSFP